MIEYVVIFFFICVGIFVFVVVVLWMVWCFFERNLKCFYELFEIVCRFGGQVDELEKDMLKIKR